MTTADRIRSMVYDDKLTDKQIGRILGYSVKHIKRLRGIFGIERLGNVSSLPHDKIVQMLSKGKTHLQIAMELEVSRQCVTKFCLKHGLKKIKQVRPERPRKYTHKNPPKELFEEWENSGLSHIEMARRLGVSHGTIRRWMRIYQVPHVYRKRHDPNWGWRGGV